MQYYGKGVCNTRQMFVFKMCYFESSASFCKRCEVFCIFVHAILKLCVKFGNKEAKFLKCKQMIKK